MHAFRRSNRAAIHVSLCATVAILIPSPRAQAEPTYDMARIRAATEARTARIHDCSVLWEQSSLVPKGAISAFRDKNGGMLGPVGGPAFPPEDATLRASGAILARRGAIATTSKRDGFTVNDEFRKDDSQEFRVIRDGVGKWLMRSAGQRDPAPGKVFRAESPGAATEIGAGEAGCLQPLLGAGHLLPGFKLLRVEAGSEGDICVVGDDGGSIEYRLDARREFVPLKKTSRNADGTISVQVDYEGYAPDPGLGWRPGVIRIAESITNGRSDFIIKELNVNKGIPERAFDFEFPRGTVVTDDVESTEYVVGSPQRKARRMTLTVQGD